MPDKEATARIKINKLLEAAGWRFFADGDKPANIRLEPNIAIKTSDLDALGDNFEKIIKGFIDYLLLNAKAFPFIVLEAKAEDKNPLMGKEQARRYAKSQNCRFVILSNGNLHYFWDLERGNPYRITQANLSSKWISDYQIPLPPLEVQKEIVAEIDGYEKVINGARAVLDHYRSHIPIHPDWPIIPLGDICSFKNGLNFTKDSSGHTVKIIGVSNFKTNLFAPLADLDEVHLNAPLSDEYLVREGDILFVRSNGNPDLVGRTVLVPPPREPTTFSGFTIRGRIEDERALPVFYAHFFKSRDFAEMIKTVGQGANIRNLSQGILNELKVPLPPLSTQQAIVAEIEAEQALVAANRELIARFEKKIQATLARVWGEDAPAAQMDRIMGAAVEPDAPLPDSVDQALIETQVRAAMLNRVYHT